MSDYQRNSRDSESTDFDYFITTELPLQQIHNMLSLQNKNEDEIEKLLEKVRDSREKIKKTVRKFIRKVTNYYGHLDVPELMKKGLKHATKHNLSESEKKVFIQQVMRGDTTREFSLVGETKYSPMAKFLGYTDTKGQMLRLDPKDHSKLNELKMMYDQTLILHANVKNNTYNYRDCAAEALTGSYDRDKHDVNVSIHPVIAMLFLPHVDYIERRMLCTNIARMVLSRGQAYLRNTKFHLQAGVAPGEIDAEFELAHDIAHDPNSLEHFTDHTPITNIIKRYRCQLELYKTVLNLRQGRYYSTGYEKDDGISGFIRALNEQDWTFFDSPDLYHVQDEGTILRKLLAVFSVRPTLTQLTSFGQRHGLGFSNITNMSKTRLISLPIVNIKLPLDVNGGQPFNLTNSLTQTDTFIENRAIVPKYKSVFHSNEVCFFYANRRYQDINFASLNAVFNCRSMALPTPVVNTVKTNTTQINFEERGMRIGRDAFNIRSVCVLQRPPLNGLDIPTGSSAIIVGRDDSGQSSYFHYNPANAALRFLDPATNSYRPNDPVTYIPYHNPSVNGMGFRSEASERGTIFFYTKA